MQVPWCLQRRFVTEDIIKAGQGVVDAKRDVVVFNRYCHVYQQGELQRLCSHIRTAEVVDTWYDESNWCIRVKKVPRKRLNIVPKPSSRDHAGTGGPSGESVSEPCDDSASTSAGAGAGVGAGAGADPVHNTASEAHAGAPTDRATTSAVE